MKLPQRSPWLLAATLALLTACGGGGGGGGGETPGSSETPVVLGQPGPGDPDNWMPTAVSNRWLFRGTTSGTGGTRSYTNYVEITGTSSVNGVPTVRLQENNYGGEPTASVSDITYDNNGLAVLRIDDGAAGTAGLVPYWDLRFPLTPGSRFVQRDRQNIDFGADLDGDGRNETANIRSEVTVVGTESVTVPLGTFAGALRVNRSSTITVRLSRDGSSVVSTETASAWYAKNVGWVRRTQTVSAGGLSTSIDEGLEAYFVAAGSAGIQTAGVAIASGTVGAGGQLTYGWFALPPGRYTATLSGLSGAAELVVPEAPQCERGSGPRDGALPEDCVFTHARVGPLLAQVRAAPGTRFVLTVAPAVTVSAPANETGLVVVSTPTPGQVAARGTSTYETNGLGSGGRYSITISGLDTDADLLVFSDSTYSMPVCGLTGVGDVLPVPEECVVDNTLGSLYFQVRAGELNTTGASFQITVVPVP